MKKPFIYIVFVRVLVGSLYCLLFLDVAFSQSIRPDGSRHSDVRTAVPFLLIAPDARSAGMGDVGVATAPDAFAMHRNAARYVLAEDNAGVGLGFTPWLRRLANDISLSYLAGFAKLSDRQAIAASLKYFSLGEVRFADGQGLRYEALAFDFAYLISTQPQHPLHSTMRFALAYGW